ncbi:LysR substrate-binding domain-containing protein [Acrocarpospora macrocephala]|uniref:LysR family transcriptional regulator n=1 Tax=Acrocarpospora macrocephala TaxID=150177 RepID=A0A5M3WRQ0_9ACTN|nr:LysR family transcriptional regulator [Acrocarpospora macrocephala]GES12057.1 LysR family transcriptional regulator [Acrocarpospora macrocephala]
MDFRQLERFLAVVDHGGFHRAAEALYVAQPSLSQSIKQLERELGDALFHRVGRGVVLTEAGRALVEPARAVVHTLRLAIESVEAVHGLRTGRLEITAMPSQAIAPLAGVISRFTAEYPGVRVVVRAGATADQVVEAVRTGRTELGLLAGVRLPQRPGVGLHPVARQRFVVVTSAGGPFPAGARVGPDDLSGLRVIAGQTGTGMRAVVDELIRSGVELTIAVETEHREAILPLVLARSGIAVLADSWRETAERAGAVVVDLDPPVHLEVAYVSHAGGLGPAARMFLRMATDQER